MADEDSEWEDDSEDEDMSEHEDDDEAGFVGSWSRSDNNERITLRFNYGLVWSDQSKIDALV